MSRPQGIHSLLLNASGKLDLAHNWFKPGHVSTFGTLTGIISDDGDFARERFTGFRGESVQDFRLASTSVARNAGTTFASAFSAGHDVKEEYVKHQGKRVRNEDAVIDLGSVRSGVKAGSVYAFRRQRVETCALTELRVGGKEFVRRLPASAIVIVVVEDDEAARPKHFQRAFKA